jgi:hypothetical protein
MVIFFELILSCRACMGDEEELKLQVAAAAMPYGNRRLGSRE